MGSSKRIGSLSIKTGSLGPGMHNSMDLGEIEEFEAVIESEPIMLDSEASDLLLKDSEVAVDIDPETHMYGQGRFGKVLHGTMLNLQLGLSGS
jgi:hypothetical protein